MATPLETYIAALDEVEIDETHFVHPKPEPTTTIAYHIGLLTSVTIAKFVETTTQLFRVQLRDSEQEVKHIKYKGKLFIVLDCVYSTQSPVNFSMAIDLETKKHVILYSDCFVGPLTQQGLDQKVTEFTSILSCHIFKRKLVEIAECKEEDSPKRTRNA